MRVKALGGVLLAALLNALALVTPALGGDAASRTVTVPRVTIYPGDVIHPSLLSDVVLRADVGMPKGVHMSADDVAGRIARRTLIVGQPIPIDAIRVPFVVQQGQALTLLYEIEGMQITASGEAMQSAGLGEQIKVRNLDTGATISGRIRDGRTVLVETR